MDDKSMRALLDDVRDWLAGNVEPPMTRGRRVAIVGIYRDGQYVSSKVGRGATWPDAAGRAVHRLIASGQMNGVDASSATIELWTRDGDAKDPMDFDLGLDGFEVMNSQQPQTVETVLRPSVPLTRGTIGTDNEIPAFIIPASTRIHRYRHFLSNARADAVQLQRLRPRRTSVTRQRAQRAIDMACDRLIAVQSPAGEYRYLDHAFLPTPDRPMARMNIVRLAGSAYAMSMAAARESDPDRAQKLSNSAERAVDLLLAHSIPFGGGWLIRRPDDAAGDQPTSAGAAALTLLALQYGELRDRHREHRRLLVEGLLSLHQNDGHFRGMTSSKIAAEETDSQNYFPGETLLALVHEAEGGDGRCYAHVTQAFDAYVDHFRRSPSVSFGLWQADVWWHVWRLIGGPLREPMAMRYADFVREIADFLIRRQIVGSSAKPQRRGGFGSAQRIPGIGSSCFTEAVIKAYLVSRDDPPTAKAYARAAWNGVNFVAQLQIDPVISGMLPRPRTSVGAFTTSLIDFTLRNDNDQHAITMFAAALDAPGLLPS